MEFINIRGEKVVVPPEGTKKVAVKKAKAATDATHKGWLAVGYSPEQLKEAEKNHEWSDSGTSFSAESYMRKHKPTKIRVKPYFSSEAAADACRLAEKAGWVGCRTMAVEKGGSGG